MAAERREGVLCSANALSNFLSLQSKSAKRLRGVKMKDQSRNDGRIGGWKGGDKKEVTHNLGRNDMQILTTKIKMTKLLVMTTVQLC